MCGNLRYIVLFSRKVLQSLIYSLISMWVRYQQTSSQIANSYIWLLVVCVVMSKTSHLHFNLLTAFAISSKSSGTTDVIKPNWKRNADIEQCSRTGRTHCTICQQSSMRSTSRVNFSTKCCRRRYQKKAQTTVWAWNFFLLKSASLPSVVSGSVTRVGV